MATASTAGQYEDASPRHAEQGCPLGRVGHGMLFNSLGHFGPPSTPPASE